MSGQGRSGGTEAKPRPPGTDAPHPGAGTPAAPGPTGRGAAHGEPAEAVIATLGSDAAHGLDPEEARRRLERYGPNRLKSAAETPWWKRLLEQFQNFLVIILLVATAISMIEWLLQDPRESALPYEAIVILAIVVLNALLGFFQEARAERSVRALMALAAPESTVVRDGERLRIARACDRSRRRPAGRGRRQDPGRRAPDREREPPDRRGAADRREPAGGEGARADRRRCRPRRPPQHALRGHGRDLRPRPRRRRRDRDGDRGRPHRRPARGRREGPDAAPAGARPHRQAADRRSCWRSARSCSRPALLTTPGADAQHRC